MQLTLNVDTDHTWLKLKKSRQRIERERERRINNIELFNGVSVVQIKPQLQKKTVKTSVDLPGFAEIRPGSSRSPTQPPINIASIEEIARTTQGESAKKSKPKSRVASTTLNISPNDDAEQSVEATLVIKSPGQVEDQKKPKTPLDS